MATKDLKKEIEKYLALRWTYTVEWWDDHGGYYVVRVNELPGICTDGKTIEEAFEDIQEPMRLYFKSCLENGDPIPVPLEREQFKGQFSVRTSPLKHYKLACASKTMKKSINQLLNEAIDQVLDQAS